MAFGGLRGTLTANAVSIPNPAVINGSVAVSVGDLVYAVVGEQTGATTTTCSDNLGNTYTATSAATDAGTSTGHAWWSRVTVAGTLTQVRPVATASSQNYAAFAAVIEGPFASSPLDANPANITSDITSPFNCPTTGTLAQASEVVIGWGVATGSTAWTATSPNLLAGQAATATVLKVAIGYQAVAATTAVIPVFAAAANPTDAVLGTTSFKRDLTAALSGTSSITFTTAGTVAGSAPVSGTTSVAFTTAGSLAAVAPLSGTSGVAFSTAGSLAGSAALAGATSLALVPAGDLTVEEEEGEEVALSGTIGLAFGATASLTIAGGEPEVPGVPGGGGGAWSTGASFTRSQWRKHKEELAAARRALEGDATPAEVREAVEAAVDGPQNAPPAAISFLLEEQAALRALRFAQDNVARERETQQLLTVIGNMLRQAMAAQKAAEEQEEEDAIVAILMAS